MSPRLILASESPYRRELLDRLALPYEALSHRCDERALPEAESLEEQALALARAKAESLAADHGDAFILASDQIAALDGEALHKPETEARAIAQLQRLQGRSHRLLTAVALRSPDGSMQSALDIHTMTMRALSREEIERYVAHEQPLDCCGSYKIERMGIALLETIEGADFSAITGLPLIATSTLLRRAGFSIP